tara:strand:- start:6226 stop:8241 length:2016 start_codon:yes stop_codon:yes gene_type:complete
MALGYGYVRDAKPMQINWQEVGKQMTDSIQAEITDRQNRKDDIDKQLTQYNKDLLNQPQGTNAEVNRFMGDFSADAGEAMRNAERMLKSGNLSERDFYKFRANANQGTDLMFEAGKKFNEGYDESMRRFADGESQSKENWMRQQTEGFLAFANNGAYINPLTGEVNVARRYKDENGEWQISTKPGEFANASELVQQASAKYNKYDLDGSINKAIKGLGATLIKESSGLTTKQFFQAIQDGTLGDKEQLLLDKAKLNMVASFTANPDHVSSILTENMGFAANGKAYTFTYDEDEAKKPGNENLILVNPDGTNNFTTPNGKKQLQAAEDFASAQFEAGLGGEREEAQDPTKQQEIQNKQAQAKIDLEREKFEFNKTKPQTLTDTQKQNIALRKKEIGYLKSIDNIISGDTATAQSSIDALIQGANVIYGKSPGIPNIVDAVRSEDGKTLTVTRRNSKDQTTSTPYDISDPNKAGEVMVEIFFPNVKGSYEELLKDFNAEGGFTTRMIKNPDYKVNEKGVPLDPSIEPLIPNPNYKGNTAVGKTTQETTIDQDFNSAEVLGETASDVKPLKVVIKEITDDMTWKFADGPLKRSISMADGIEEAFKILKEDLPNLDVRSKATTTGLELTIPSLFEGTLLLPNSTSINDKRTYVEAVKEIFNSIAKGLPFEKSKFE